MPHLFFFSALWYTSVVQYNLFSETTQFLRLMSFLVSLNHLKIGFYIFTSYCSRNNTFTAVNSKMFKAVYEMERPIAKERNKFSFNYKIWDKLVTQENHLNTPSYRFLTWKILFSKL